MGIKEMGVYTEDQIVRGRKEMSNGSVAGYVMNAEGKEVWRIVTGGRGRAPGSKNRVQSKCGFNDASRRCSRKHEGNHNEWCHVRAVRNPETGRKVRGKFRCVKSGLGNKESPKRPLSDAQRRVLARGQAKIAERNALRSMADMQRGG